MSQSQPQKFLGAARTGDCATVKLLLPFVDPSANESAALRVSSVNGHIEIVKLLLPLSDPMAQKSYALRYATLMGYTEIIDLLYQVSNIEDVLRGFQKNGKISKGISYLERRFKADQDKAFLESGLLGEKEDKVKKSCPKKM